MAVSPQEVLDVSAAVLPTSVAAALLDLGNACNDAAVAVHSATSRQLQETAIQRAHDSTGHAGPFVQRVAHQRQQLVDQQFDQAVIAMSCVAAVYAAYASSVAAAALAGLDPPLPESVVVRRTAEDDGLRTLRGTDAGAMSPLFVVELARPSDVMSRFDHYLPELRFDLAVDSDVRGQHEYIAKLHRELITMIIYRLRDERYAYDDVAAVGVGDFLLRRCDFPDALHRYATALVVALGMLTVQTAGGRAG
jgi:hypothetical protein